jgi:hypothetical protein
MGKFNELWDMLHAENIEATKTKKHHNVPYSKKKEDILTQALLNDAEYETEIIKSKGGEYLKEKITPVAEFRRLFIGKVLSDNGIDKQQAADQATKYEFNAAQAHALNEIAKESAEQFMRAGFTYKFHDKKDFSASIKMRDVEDRITTGRVPGTDRTTKTREKEHKVIIKKSGTPRYCKERLEDDE